MAKVGRPRNTRKYRQNIIRFSLLEDAFERVLKEIPPRSVKARKIVQSELHKLRANEIQKVKHFE